MLELLMAGGPGMIPIVVCSILLLALVVERLWSLRRGAAIPPGLADEVRAWAVNKQLDTSHMDALEKHSPLGRVLAGALRVRHLGRDAVRERVEDVGRHVMHQMHRFLNTLGTLALIAPLLGLLGTVVGLIRMFLAVMTHGVGDAQYMAGGIGEALICTASGLVVAVPAYIFHRMLRGRIAGYAMDIEREVMSMLDFIDGTATMAAPIRKVAK